MHHYLWISTLLFAGWLWSCLSSPKQLLGCQFSKYVPLFHYSLYLFSDFAHKEDCTVLPSRPHCPIDPTCKSAAALSRRYRQPLVPARWRTARAVPNQNTQPRMDDDYQMKMKQRRGGLTKHYYSHASNNTSAKTYMYI